MPVSSAGNTRGLIEASLQTVCSPSFSSLPRGIPAASLKPSVNQAVAVRVKTSSAGNTRGLIEAQYERPSPAGHPSSLPRGIPAASLKQHHRHARRRDGDRLPRGIPAASLKHGRTWPSAPALCGSSAGNTRGLIEAAPPSCRARRHRGSSAGNTRGLIEATSTAPRPPYRQPSSAGNTRGLIEARRCGGRRRRWPCLPRGIPAASLKPGDPVADVARVACLPRGIPAASLKRRRRGAVSGLAQVFRGEYPRPH